MGTESLHTSTVYKSALAVNIAFLAVHVCFFICFALLHITVMAVVNVFSISTYIITLFLLHKERILLFAYTT